MVHLVVHLLNEALPRGPVQYSWMFLVERRLGYLKSTVRKKARPEGSIEESYISDECLIFSPRYLKEDIETSFNKPDRNKSKNDKKKKRHKSMRGSLSIFSDGDPIGIGACFEEWRNILRYILDNCPQVEKYMEHVSIT